MSPTFLHLRCAVGECGPVAQGASDNCPTQCFANTQCSHCLHQAWCGWCPVPGVNGSGICLSGGLLGPIDGVCSSQEISSIHGPLPGKSLFYLFIYSPVMGWIAVVSYKLFFISHSHFLSPLSLFFFLGGGGCPLSSC